jgi:crotonobetainyl-CoA:carnitine CoA-transferase CaiB-like acyl-CoA transferase
MTKVEACSAMGAAGLPAGPCLADEEVVADPHVAARGMLLEIPRTDGVAQPVLTPGNPVRMSAVPAQPTGRRPPWLGEHTTEVLSAELGMSGDQIEALREAGVID